MEREKFGSRLGFILVSAGCAVGLGNVWKFPYMCGQYGGAAFIAIYLVFLVILGYPIIVCEFAVGRGSQKSCATSFRKLEPKGRRWHYNGYIGMAGCYLLMMYYTMVTGWMLYYFFRYLTGSLTSQSMTTEQVSSYFSNMLASPGTMILFMIIAVVLSFAICSLGLKNGVERITKVMMICLLGLILVLAVHSCLLPGSGTGIRFYLVPDFTAMQAKGIGNVIFAAMSQAFFTLSIGIGAMAIFGSYIEKDRSLMGESIHIIVLDTLVAVIAGIIIFPACFTYGLEVKAGPSLLFDTMAAVFNNMSGGRIWGSLFFLFMVFAALSTVLGVCENLLAMVREYTGWSRPKGCVACGTVIFLAALTTALGYSVFHFQPFAKGTAWLDFWDFIVSNNVLPLGSLMLAVFCCYKIGWGWDRFLMEANEGKGMKVKNWMRPVFQYLLPLVILFIYIYGMITFQWK